MTLSASHIDAITTSVIGVLPYVQGGTARALATFDTERSDRLPDVPPRWSSVSRPGDAAWYGLLAPAGLPARRAQAFEAQVAGGVALARGGTAARDIGGVADPGHGRAASDPRCRLQEMASLLPKLAITAQ